MTFFFLERAFKLAGSSHSLKAVPDGAQALEYLTGEGIFADRTRHPFPDLILLDINMPKKSGFDVLAWLAQPAPLQFASSPDSHLLVAPGRHGEGPPAWCG